MGTEELEAVSPGAPAEPGEPRRLMKDALVNNLAAPVSTVVGILLVPLMLRALGQDDYGLWIVATSISGMVAALDFGLYWSINRVVAADAGGGLGDNSDFVRSAANVFLLVGLAGCVFVGGAGLFSGDRLHLPAAGGGTVSLVFWLVGATLFAERLSASGFAVLAGLRRFDLINLIAVVATVAWGAAAAALLMGGAGVAAVAFAQLAVSALKGVGTLLVAARLAPNYGFRPFFLRWGALRRHASFAVSSLLVDGFSSVAWNSAPALIGFISGPAAAVPFHIGQKFPIAVSAMGGRAAEVVFPAASESRHDAARSAEVLRTGSRWVVVLVLPFAALLFATAPELLRAWVGDPPPGSVSVLRVMALTVLAEAALLSPVNLLWGRGAMRPILVVYAAKGIGVVALTLALVGRFGVAGAAWGMFVPIAAGAAALFILAARECGIEPSRLAAGTAHGLLLPALASGVTASSVLHFGGGGRIQVALALVLGGLAYLAALFGFSGTHEEKRFARGTLSRLKAWCSHGR